MEINFEKEIESVFSGEVYKRIGLKDDPFTIDPKDKVNLFVDRYDSFNKLLRSIRNMKSGTQEHIAILGSHGIGKTHFIEFAYEIIKENKDKIGISNVFYVKGKKGFKEEFSSSETSTILNYIKDNSNAKILVFFDDLDVIFKRNPEQVMNLFDSISNSIIGTWDTNAWNLTKQNKNYKMPKTEAIFIDRLHLEFSKQLINKRLKHLTYNNTKLNKVFPTNVIENLAVISDGNPYKLITYAKRYLDFLIDENLTEITPEKFEEFSEKIKIRFIEDVKKNVESLSDKQKEVLSFVIDSIEVSAMEVANKFNTSRVAGMTNLKELKDKKILESKTKDRTDYYYVPTEIVFDIADYLEKIKGNRKSEQSKNES